MFVNGVVRLGWGLGALLNPSAMATASLVPDTETRPDARLFVRGFGAHQVGAAVLALGALSRPRLERPALVLAVALDVVDNGLRSRRGPRPRTAGRRHRGRLR